MSIFFEINADANARQSMLEQHLRRSSKKSGSVVKKTKKCESSPLEATAKSDAESHSCLSAKCDCPVVTPIFDELHQALEALRRQPAHLRRVAKQRLAAARRWCDARQFQRAMHELKMLAADLTGDRTKPDEASPAEQCLRDEQLVAHYVN